MNCERTVRRRIQQFPLPPTPRGSGSSPLEQAGRRGCLERGRFGGADSLTAKTSPSPDMRSQTHVLHPDFTKPSLLPYLGLRRQCFSHSTSQRACGAGTSSSIAWERVRDALCRLLRPDLEPSSLTASRWVRRTLEFANH